MEEVQAAAGAVFSHLNKSTRKVESDRCDFVM